MVQLRCLYQGHTCESTGLGRETQHLGSTVQGHPKVGKPSFSLSPKYRQGSERSRLAHQRASFLLLRLRYFPTLIQKKSSITLDIRPVGQITLMRPLLALRDSISNATRKSDIAEVNFFGFFFCFGVGWDETTSQTVVTN